MMEQREVRCVVANLKDAVSLLESKGARLEGEYAFKDVIYTPTKGTYNLNEEFTRMRISRKNDWLTKKIVLIRKRITISPLGKESKMLLQKEFDTEEEANEWMRTEYPTLQTYFAYERMGRQYSLGKLCIFVEDIEGYKPSVEIESNNAEEAEQVLKELHPLEILNDTMPAIMKKVLGK